MNPVYKHAIVKFNNGNGALLCNRCGVIVANGFRHEDRKHYCSECAGKPEDEEDFENQ